MSIKGSFPDSPFHFALAWPRGDFSPTASMASSPGWHFALPPAGGDREWEPPQTPQPVPTGPRPSPETLSPGDAPCHLQAILPRALEYMRGRETEAQSTEVAGGGGETQGTFLSPFREGAEKQGKPTACSPEAGLRPGGPAHFFLNERSDC